MNTDTEHDITSTFRVRVAGGGRVVIPQPIRDELGIASGDAVLVQRDSDGIRILTTDQAVSQAKAIVARHIPTEIDLVSDLRMLRDRDDTGR